MDFLTKLEAIIEKLCKAVEGLAPVAAAVGVVTGQPEVVVAAKAATVIATATDTAILSHEASPQGTKDTVAVLAKIAHGVADSGLLKETDAQKIKAVVAALPQELYTSPAG